MKVLGIIPARYGSSRFPGKPLAMIHGQTMINRVYNQAIKSSLLTDVVVATDDNRIATEVLAFGGKVVMTNPSHLSGTDRCAEVLALSDQSYDLVINIQGDEPFIHPQQIDLVANCFLTSSAGIATLVKIITNTSDIDNINIPKVVRSSSGHALYFSRRAIPYCNENQIENLVKKGVFYKHIGIYGYRADILPHLAKLPTGILESSESLEQLRWLENGFQIMTAVTNHENWAIDVPEDIAIVERKFDVSC